LIFYRERGRGDTTATHGVDRDNATPERASFVATARCSG